MTVPWPLSNRKKKSKKKKEFYFFWLSGIMASLASLKAPKLLSKKTQKDIQNDEDDVLIDASAVPTSSSDVVMEEVKDKPSFTPASAAEEKVREKEWLENRISWYDRK